MLALVTCMGVMTGDAASALFSVHMKIMQIIFFIPKACQFSSLPGFGHILIMTTETKIIFFRLILIIKTFWKITDEKTTELRAVYIMSLCTGTCFYRTMEVFAVGNLLSKFFMAGAAEVDPGTIVG